MRNDDKAVAFEAPSDATAKAKPVLEEVDGVLQRRPDIHLAELRRIEIFPMEDLSVGVQELAEVRLPTGRRVQNLRPGIIVHDGKAGAGRAVTDAGFPWHGEPLVEVVGRVGRRDERILKVNVKGNAKVQLGLRVAAEKLPRRVDLVANISDRSLRFLVDVHGLTWSLCRRRDDPQSGRR